MALEALPDGGPRDLDRIRAEFVGLSPCEVDVHLADYHSHSATCSRTFPTWHPTPSTTWSYPCATTRMMAFELTEWKCGSVVYCSDRVKRPGGWVRVDTPAREGKSVRVDIPVRHFPNNKEQPELAQRPTVQVVEGGGCRLTLRPFSSQEEPHPRSHNKLSQSQAVMLLMLLARLTQTNPRATPRNLRFMLWLFMLFMQ